MGFRQPQAELLRLGYVHSTCETRWPRLQSPHDLATQSLSRRQLGDYPTLVTVSSIGNSDIRRTEDGGIRVMLLTMTIE